VCKKMLRCISRQCLRLREQSQSSLRLTAAFNAHNVGPSAQLQLHTSSIQNSLEKDLMDKKKVIKLGQESKLENLDTPQGEAAVEVSLDGMNSAGGISIPTLETLSMTINGIPFDQLPVIHIKATTNNTHICLTNHTGKTVMDLNTCGKEGFKHVKKSTSVAAQATGYSLGYRTKKKGIQAVRVIVKGLGAGRLPAITGIQMAGLQVVSISDMTPLAHGWDCNKARKARRL